MSYDITSKRLARLSTADLRAQQGTEDVERGDFLRRLDSAPFAVTDFEAGLIESFLGRTCRPEVWWTAKRRECVDRMREKYEGRMA